MSKELEERVREALRDWCIAQGERVFWPDGLDVAVARALEAILPPDTPGLSAVRQSIANRFLAALREVANAR